MSARVDRVRPRIGRVALAEGEHPRYQHHLHLPESKHETVGRRRGPLLAYRDIELHAIRQPRTSRAVLFARLPRHGRWVGLNLPAGLLGLGACGRVFPQTANLLGPRPRRLSRRGHQSDFVALPRPALFQIGSLTLPGSRAPTPMRAVSPRRRSAGARTAGRNPPGRPAWPRASGPTPPSA